ncbi:hypothetical protein ILYODFUR_034905, partial [Ilyodon furcidens]
GRTKGRVVVDEEDSMDGTEITETTDSQYAETQIQPVETVEMETTEAPEEENRLSPLAQSPPAESSTGPSVPASGEIKSRSVTLNVACPVVNIGYMYVYKRN